MIVEEGVALCTYTLVCNLFVLLIGHGVLLLLVNQLGLLKGVDVQLISETRELRGRALRGRVEVRSIRGVFRGRGDGRSGACLGARSAGEGRG